MNIDRKVIEQALEALEQSYSDLLYDYAGRHHAYAFEADIAALREALAQPVQQEPVAAQQRFRHPQKTMPDWSPWQPCKVADRPAWQIDSQGYEVEYRALYTSPQAQPAKPLTKAQRAKVCVKAEAAMQRDQNLSWRDALINETEQAHGIPKGTT